MFHSPVIVFGKAMSLVSALQNCFCLWIFSPPLIGRGWLGLYLSISCLPDRKLELRKGEGFFFPPRWIKFWWYPAIKLCLISFSRKPAFLKKRDCPGAFQKGSCFVASVERRRRFFPDIHQVELLHVGFTNCGPCTMTWRKNWQPTLVFLPGKSHGWRSLVGYSP